MRIISGTFKGRRFSPPTNLNARPTTDFAKEGLFNLLNNQIDFEDIEVLDLFAGTGSIGLEFISRGCSSAIAIEENEKHCSFIKKVSADLKIKNLSVLKADVFKYLTGCHLKFDLIFADPPYSNEKLPTLPDLIFEYELLKPDGIFILEHSSKNSFKNHTHFQDHRNYGNVNFSFFSF